MNIAFVKPPVGGILGLEMLTFVEPLGMECVAGALEIDGHQCKIIDLRIEGREKGLRKCWEFAPDVVGIQCNFTTERHRGIRLAREIKRHLPETFVVLGGHDASRDPTWFQDEAIDVVALGEGEDVMPPLVAALERGDDIAKSPGLMINTKDGPRATGPAPARRELDDLPMPARHLIEDYASDYYINFRKPLALMETARGCPFKCNFCSVWKFHEKSFREKSPERVVEELKAIDAPNIFITDDIFWLNVHRGKEMARQIKASGIRKYFTVQTRTDIICRHPELIEMWKDCGDFAIFLGLEKVDDEGLKSVNKNNKAQNNVRAIEILKELKVGFTCNFIVDPSWERKDFAQLRRWIEENNTYNSGFSVLTPLPGTDLWDEVKQTLTTDDWELFDYSRLWRWALHVRYKNRGKLNTYMQMVAALAMRRVTFSAVRKGMNLAKVFSKPKTFMIGHHKSSTEQAEMSFV